MKKPNPAFLPPFLTFVPPRHSYPVYPAMVRLCLMALFASSMVVCYAQDALDAPKFEADIRPILREYCLDCHGASDQIEGSLDLRLVRFMLRGGDSGPALIAGNADASLILQRVESEDMPPGTLKVSPEKIAILRAWIANGAPTNG